MFQTMILKSMLAVQLRDINKVLLLGLIILTSITSSCQRSTEENNSGQLKQELVNMSCDSIKEFNDVDLHIKGFRHVDSIDFIVNNKKLNNSLGLLLGDRNGRVVYGQYSLKNSEISFKINGKYEFVINDIVYIQTQNCSMDKCWDICDIHHWVINGKKADYLELDSLNLAD